MYLDTGYKTEPNSLLGLRQEYVLSDHIANKLWRQDAFLHPIFFPQCSFYLLLQAEWFLIIKLFLFILKSWLVLPVMKWALTGEFALNMVQFYIYIFSCVIFILMSLSSEAKLY